MAVLCVCVMQRSALQRLAACAGARDLQWRCLKTETGIVGLAVDPKAREHLREKVLSVLDTIKVVPKTAEYRKNVESTFSARCALRLAYSRSEVGTKRMVVQCASWLQAAHGGRHGTHG